MGKKVSPILFRVGIEKLWFNVQSISPLHKITTNYIMAQVVDLIHASLRRNDFIIIGSHIRVTLGKLIIHVIAFIWVSIKYRLKFRRTQRQRKYMRRRAALFSHIVLSILQYKFLSISTNKKISVTLLSEYLHYFKIFSRVLTGFMEKAYLWFQKKSHSLIIHPAATFLFDDLKSMVIPQISPLENNLLYNN